MRRRILTLLTASLVAVCAGSSLVASKASAQYVPELCYLGDSIQCLNAWNSGPYVNSYSEEVGYSDFLAIYNANSGTFEIQYQGGGNYSNDCVGDYANDPNNARAGLFSNCITGQPVAWGAVFKEYNCPGPAVGTVAFYDIHWKGWLGPAGSGNGAPFYLNKPTKYCFSPSSEA